MGTRILGKCFAAVAGLLFCTIATQTHAATITVTNRNDGGPGSLREALRNAHDGDTISFAVTGTIALTSGGLPITKNLTISAPGADQLSIDGNQVLLVFGIFPDKIAAIGGLTINNGQTGIWNEQGTLTVSNCAVSSNSGVGLYNDGTLTVSNCVVSSNSQFGIGNNGILGPSPPVERGNHRRDPVRIYYHPVGIAPVTIENSMIRDNSGPGVDNNSGTVTIVNSTLTGNHNPADQDSGYGGGISTYGGKLPGYVSVSNST